MTEKKKIIINRDFLSLTKKRKKKKPKWHKPKLNTNSLKKKLINKIKKYKNDQKFQNPQIHNEFINKKENNNNNNNIKPKLVDDDFKSTLQTMDNIIKQRKEKKRLKKDKKRLRKKRRLQKKLQKKINSENNKVDCENNTININKFISDIKDVSSIPIYNNNLNNIVNNNAINDLNNNQNNNQKKPNIKFSINNNRNKNTNRNEITNIKNKISIHTKKNKNIKLDNEPLWGCLKNGKKPTFKQYKKSLKMKKEKIKISNTINDDNNLSNNLNNNNNPIINTNKENIEIRKNKLKKIKNKTKRLTKTMKRWKLGKINNYVSVLIKSKKIRNMINKDIKTIRKTPVKQAKDYLNKRNLLKQGSQAPNDVVKIIYENSLLSGDIYNTNPETLLHNFINAIN